MQPVVVILYRLLFWCGEMGGALLIRENGSDRLSRKVGKELPLFAA